MKWSYISFSRSLENMWTVSAYLGPVSQTLWEALLMSVKSSEGHAILSMRHENAHRMPSRCPQLDQPFLPWAGTAIVCIMNIILGFSQVTTAFALCFNHKVFMKYKSLWALYKMACRCYLWQIRRKHKIVCWRLSLLVMVIIVILLSQGSPGINK